MILLKLIAERTNCFKCAIFITNIASTDMLITATMGSWLIFMKILHHIIIYLYFLVVKLNSYFTDGEADWQDRISSGFDRLVAFASTELDKRRRSTEGVNTSPDSGLGSDSTATGPPPVVPSPDEALGPPRTPSPTSPRPANPNNGSASSNSSVPLKYQRQVDPERHHFKKKFFHRDWNNSGSTSKFRPKGKDWDWNHSGQWPPNDEQT